MSLEEYGYNDTIERLINEHGLSDFKPGRVTAEHRERYVVQTKDGETEAEVSGNLRFSARGREDFPAVGDWVALIGNDYGPAIIFRILPRRSLLSRRAAGQAGSIQLIAANIDYAMIMLAADRDFSINRLERYLTICHSSKVKPVIVLTKTDVEEEEKIARLSMQISERIHDVPLIALSNITKTGYDALENLFIKGNTYCLLGSSGVGKSTLINALSGRQVMKTGSISSSSDRGRHVTSHRELIVLDNGAIMIDNPGMREVGVGEQSDGIEITFDDIVALSSGCRFKDCTHTIEKGCAVLEALEKGEIDRKLYENYLKISREKEHFEATVAEKRRKDKDFGKMLKNFKKDIKKIK